MENSGYLFSFFKIRFHFEDKAGLELEMTFLPQPPPPIDFFVISHTLDAVIFSLCRKEKIKY